MIVLRNIAAVIVCIIVWVISYFLLGVVLSFLGSIPILGSMLYWPSDASWALIVMPPTISAILAAVCSTKICGHSYILSSIIILLFVIGEIAVIFEGQFTWSSLISTVFGILGSIIGMFGFND